jgi:hypothetical protein
MMGGIFGALTGAGKAVYGSADLTAFRNDAVEGKTWE